jgi:hypothetical protein
MLPDTTTYTGGEANVQGLDFTSACARKDVYAGCFWHAVEIGTGIERFHFFYESERRVPYELDVDHGAFAEIGGNRKVSGPDATPGAASALLPPRNMYPYLTRRQCWASVPFRAGYAQPCHNCHRAILLVEAERSSRHDRGVAVIVHARWRNLGPAL